MKFACTKKWTSIILLPLLCFSLFFCFSIDSFAISPSQSFELSYTGRSGRTDYTNGTLSQPCVNICLITSSAVKLICFSGVSFSGTRFDSIVNSNVSINGNSTYRFSNGDTYYYAVTLDPSGVNRTPSVVSSDNVFVLDKSSSPNYSWTSFADEILSIIDNSFNPPVSDIEGIGYLKNVNQKSGIYQIKSSALIVEDYGYKIGFDATTTTGFSVIDGSAEVIISGDLSVRSGSSLRKLGNFSSAPQTINYSGTSFNIDASDALSFVRANNDTGNYSDYMYYLTNVSFKIRPISNRKYGGWTLLRFSDYDGNTQNYSSVSSSNVNDEGVVDGINQNGTGTSNQNFGVGGSAADASGNITERPNNQLDASKLTENLSSLASEVQAMVGVLASLFGWLPDWCLILMGSCIASLFVIAVLKVALF